MYCHLLSACITCSIWVNVRVFFFLTKLKVYDKLMINVNGAVCVEIFSIFVKKALTFVYVRLHIFRVRSE